MKNKTNDERYLAVFGNPMDGLTFYGPFESVEDAQDFCEGEDGDWWIAGLNKPYDEASEQEAAGYRLGQELYRLVAKDSAHKAQEGGAS